MLRSLPRPCQPVNDDDQRAGIGCVLDFAFVGVGDARARTALRRDVRHMRRLPIVIAVLHLGPEVVIAMCWPWRSK